MKPARRDRRRPGDSRHRPRRRHHRRDLGPQRGAIGKTTIFRASEGIGVILHEPERAGELVNAAVAAGATGTRGPNFFAGNPEAAYNNTLLAAFDQAKGKAAALATRAGATLGPALTIEEASEAVPVEGARETQGSRRSQRRLRPPSRAPPQSPPPSASSSPWNNRYSRKTRRAYRLSTS